MFDTTSKETRQLTSKDQQLLKNNSSTFLTDFKKRKLEIDAKRHWDIFYKNNTVNFFKDRNWLQNEFDGSGFLKGGDNNHDDSKKIDLIEIGCGVGNTVFPLLATNPNITISATDFSPRAVNFVLDRANQLEDQSQKDRLKIIFVSDLSQENCFESIDNLYKNENPENKNFDKIDSLCVLGGTIIYFYFFIFFFIFVTIFSENVRGNHKTSRTQ